MKKILATVLASAMVLALAACGGGGNGGTNNNPPAGNNGGGSSAPAPAGDKTAINVIISQYGNYTQEWWTQFEKDFEAANDTVDLNIEIVSWNDIYTVVSTRIQSEQQPDILNISGFTDYVADDLLMKAEDYVSEKTKNNFIPSFWESNSIDGTVWALPLPPPGMRSLPPARP